MPLTVLLCLCPRGNGVEAEAGKACSSQEHRNGVQVLPLLSLEMLSAVLYSLLRP